MTLDETKARLAVYLAAEVKILQGQEYSIGQGTTARRLRRADLADVRAEIQILQSQVASLTPRRVCYVRNCW